MKPKSLIHTTAFAAFVLLAGAVTAGDVDGPDDCQRTLNDRGDAPEGFLAYPSVAPTVIGHFPTCTAPSAPGTMEASCPPISTAPGLTGFVLHVTATAGTGYWLGCGTLATGPMGIDSEPDGKTSAGGATISNCAQIPVDCIETTPAGIFGQDECFGDDDAGLVERPSLTTCSPGTVKFSTFACISHEAYLNILIDMNQDGDWNDNLSCGGTACAYEWAVKNVLIPIPSGCSPHVSPSFTVGPRAGYGWMRISISDNPVSDDFPWAGSANMTGGAMIHGETEDYVVQIARPNPCPIGYRDFGDAPEGIAAYPSGVIGHFPTCTAPSAPGTIDAHPLCLAPSGTVPGLTGYVEHVKAAADTSGFWFGCAAAGGGPFVDSEPNGKVNLIPVAGAPSVCDDATLTDCVTSVGGLSVGQDECYGDGVDAGLLSPPTFDRCDAQPLRFATFNCSSAPIVVYMNILVDWNGDGDWNDVARCERLQRCANEWAIKNLPVTLQPGCSTWTSPPIQAGPREGLGWMRATMTAKPVADDFPWNGSGSEPNGVYLGGETEDYPVVIQPSTVDVGQGDPTDAVWFTQVTPNPAKQSLGTTVQFGLAAETRVRLAAYDVRGRLLRTIVNSTQTRGLHTIEWNFRDDHGTPVAPGVYFLHLEAGTSSHIARISVTH